jgi:DNA primase large subunit
MQIIMEQGQKDIECHGCPFVTFATDNLQTALMSMYNVSSQEMGEILHLVKGQFYHVACTRVWEISHRVKKGAGLDGESVIHPNLYAAKSWEFEKARTKEEGGEDVVMAEG